MKKVCPTGVNLVARIDYLGFRGEVVERVEYKSEEPFLTDLKEQLDCGVPLCAWRYTETRMEKRSLGIFWQRLIRLRKGFPLKTFLLKHRKIGEMQDEDRNRVYRRGHPDAGRMGGDRR